MVSMIHHHDAIVRDAAKSPEFNEYPKAMAHPAFHPGSIGEQVNSANGIPHYINGQPIRFPPVLVNSADDEEYYAAKGYVSQGKSDPAAFARLAEAARPVNAGYVPVEYPKWAGGVLVNNLAEEEAALSARRDQLGIPATDETAAPTPEAPSARSLAQQAGYASLATSERLDVIEEQVGEMRQMMAELLRLTAARPVVLMAPAGEETIIEDDGAANEPEPVISQYQKSANTRRRKAAERAANGVTERAA